MSTEAAYGTWRSPITSHTVTKGTTIISEPPVTDPTTGLIFWCEQLSSEDGRSIVFHFDPESHEVVRWTPSCFNVKTKAHEYGGGAFTVYNNTLFFSHASDNVLYRQQGHQAVPTRLTHSPARRYADGVYWPQKNGLVIVCEDHSAGEGIEATTSLVLVNTNSGAITTLASNADFFASPAVSPSGSRLAWVQWNHPQMPWWETELHVGEMGSGGELTGLYSRQTGSMMTPTFGPSDDLFYIHDKTGWWNLYRLTEGQQEINLTPEEREVGWPMWTFGNRAYSLNPTSEGKEMAVISGDELRILDVESGKSRTLQTGYTIHKQGVTYSKDGTSVYVVAGDGARCPRVVRVQLKTSSVETVSRTQDLSIDPGYISIPTHIQFPTTLDDVAYGYLYLPKNKDYHAPAGSKPPLLVRVHGGPTSAAMPVLNLEYQFFTSRGFTILDVNYRGSTGYGTAFRNKLNENWGILDLADIQAGACHLVSEGLVNPAQLCIDGWSAGGYATLALLTMSGSPFSVGASYYGVSDLEKLATDTHKFESRYLDTLIGPLPEHKARYDARSPLKNCHKLQTPMIFFQGTEDKVVPPSQAREMYEIVRNKGLPTAFVLYEGEYHGFVKPENLRSALEAEMVFYSKVFGFSADVTSQVKIENLDGWKVGGQKE